MTGLLRLKALNPITDIVNRSCGFLKTLETKCTGTRVAVCTIRCGELVPHKDADQICHCRKRKETRGGKIVMCSGGSRTLKHLDILESLLTWFWRDMLNRSLESSWKPATVATLNEDLGHWCPRGTDCPLLQASRKLLIQLVQAYDAVTRIELDGCKAYNGRS